MENYKKLVFSFLAITSCGILQPMTVLANKVTSNLSMLQQHQVTGKVVDENGDPLIGVTVKTLSGKVGAVTDLNGNFSMDIPAGTKIQLSYTGYKSISVSAGAAVFRMKPDVLGLNEVVAIGYGIQKKRDLTGAITTVKSADVTMNPNANPMQALQGKVAGLDIQKTSGEAGSGISMQLRGTRSFTASGNPTFIIDGMPGDYSTLNPNDIETIEVLKDASSTAVYGASGANGVVIITTKNGSRGKIKTDFNSYLGINGWSEIPKMRTGEEYLQGIRDANKAIGNWSSSADDERVIDGVLGSGAYKAAESGNFINWPKALLKTAMTQNYSAAFSGGTDKTSAYFSLNFSDETGQYKNDDYKVYSSNIRVDHKLKPWANVGVNARMSYVYQNKAYANLDQAMTRVPIGSLYDENGDLAIQPSYGSSTNINLLLNNKGNYRNNNQNFKLYFNPYIEIKPFKGFSVLSRLQANLTYTRNNYFQGMGSYQYYNANGADAVGTNSDVYASITEDRQCNYTWENVLTYHFQVASVHDFTLTAVTSWTHDRSDETYQKESNITDNAYLWHNMGKTGDANSTVSSLYQMSKTMGYVGRIAYSYQGKYLASASVRRDGSSVLANGNKWDTFPAFSLGWRISDEKFMASTHNWLDNLKIRFGYGVTGTASLAPYSTISSLELSTMQFSDLSTPTQIYRFTQEYANKSLGWEKSYNTNIGLDATFLNGRINLTADLYRTITKGVIWSRQLPVTNGGYTSDNQFYTMNQNLCRTKNNGIELALNTNNIDTHNFKWISDVTFTANKEKITSLMDGVSNNITNGDYSLSIGYPVNSYYHYKLDGIWQKGEEADAAVFGCKPGDIKIDVPGMKKESDGKFYKLDSKGNKVYYTADNKYAYSGNDYQVLGHNSPDWTMGFQNSFKYKNFDLTIFMYWRWGQMIKYDMMTSYDPTGVNNFPSNFKYWTEDNPSNVFPAINAGRSLTQYTGYAALAYQDASYFKVKNITLGYNFKKNVLNALGMTRLRIYATITNPIIYTKNSLLKDYDPEMNGSFNYPLTRQFVFGVNLSF
jgi:TonB-linked SusC/RagA family outer membrane protein